MNKRKNSSWRKSRSHGTLPYRKKILIFSEGTETEPNYFSGFKKLIDSNAPYRSMISIEIKGVSDNTVHILDYAIQYVKNHKIDTADVWCVYDKDEFKATDFDNVVTRIDKMNNTAGLKYYAAWSNECIEYWFVLHFSNYQSNNHRKQYIANLNRVFKEYKIGKYEKNLEEIYTILAQYGDPKKAIKYAETTINKNTNLAPSLITPGTTVYKLVRELANYLPNEEKKKFLDEKQ